MSDVIAFTNGQICVDGRLERGSVFVDSETGYIVENSDQRIINTVDLRGRILAPAYMELQTNGCAGVHFTDYQTSRDYQANLEKVSRYLVSRGVGAFWVTIPTVNTDVFKKVLPQLKAQEISGGADILGAHCEGPFINPSKKGAHDEKLMQIPDQCPLPQVYGDVDTMSSIKLVTLAPELSGSLDLIRELTQGRGIQVSLGHSAADYESGVSALKAGAKTLTHVFNAMQPLHHRNPGLAGLLASEEAPYYSLIPDGIHLHPATLTMAYRANPEKCILITDSTEMAGLPDGVYPGHSQVPHQQRKVGNRVTIDGTDTLIGSCCSIDECVRNLAQWSGCGLAQAIRCATENITKLMGQDRRGIIEVGRRADFVILDAHGFVLETWIKGTKVYEAD